MAFVVEGTLVSVEPTGYKDDVQGILDQGGSNKPAPFLVSYKEVDAFKAAIGQKVRVPLFIKGIPYTKDGEKRAFAQIIGLSCEVLKA